MTEKRFSLVSIKAEGKAAHPDIWDNVDETSNAWYYRQLKAYAIDVDPKNYMNVWCSRPEILEQIKKELGDD